MFQRSGSPLSLSASGARAAGAASAALSRQAGGPGQADDRIIKHPSLAEGSIGARARTQPRPPPPPNEKWGLE
eukprot:7453012-Pyramimonas_sp.AAC.1